MAEILIVFLLILILAQTALLAGFGLFFLRSGREVTGRWEARYEQFAREVGEAARRAEENRHAEASALARRYEQMVADDRAQSARRYDDLLQKFFEREEESRRREHALFNSVLESRGVRPVPTAAEAEVKIDRERKRALEAEILTPYGEATAEDAEAHRDGWLQIEAEYAAAAREFPDEFARQSFIAEKVAELAESGAYERQFAASPAREARAN